MYVSISFLTVEELTWSGIVYMPSSVILASQISLSLLSHDFIDDSTQHFSLIDQLVAVAEFSGEVPASRSHEMLHIN